MPLRQAKEVTVFLNLGDQLRRLSVSLLNQERSFEGSQEMKRYKAAMNNEYLLNILLSGTQI